MVQPTQFSYNPSTALTNAFQNKTALTNEEVQINALQEFDDFVRKLENEGVNIHVMKSSPGTLKNDAVFPNNWISVHQDGTLCLYPMLTENRRLEREQHIIDFIKRNFKIKRIHDFSKEEQKNRIVEGTGSIVFDHVNAIAYGCRSKRTDPSLFNEISETLGYRPHLFGAWDKNQQEIYHTNVMMSVCQKFVLVCLDSISIKEERDALIESFARTNHQLIDISFDQMNAFGGNALELVNHKQEPILAISSTAYGILTPDQKASISSFTKIVPIDIPTIEHIGGGSVRCMIAELFAEKND